MGISDKKRFPLVPTERACTWEHERHPMIAVFIATELGCVENLSPVVPSVWSFDGTGVSMPNNKSEVCKVPGAGVA